MPRKSGSERGTSSASRGGLILLTAAAFGSSLLVEMMPAEGLQGSLRVLALLPVQLAALLWVVPRMR
jgi:hypothetical protein